MSIGPDFGPADGRLEVDEECVIVGVVEAANAPDNSQGNGENVLELSPETMKMLNTDPEEQAYIEKTFGRISRDTLEELGTSIDEQVKILVEHEQVQNQRCFSQPLYGRLCPYCYPSALDKAPEPLRDS